MAPAPWIFVLNAVRRHLPPTYTRLALAATALCVLGCQANDTFLDDPPAATEFACVPDLDGEITAAEVPVLIGAATTYRVSADKTAAKVSTAGVDDGKGGRLWAWDIDTKDDAVVDTNVSDPLDGWFADTFPDATFAIAIDRGGELLGLYRKDDDALWLLGFASVAPTPAAKRTLARYAQPVAVMRFPLRVGRSWTSSTKLSGAVFSGLPYAGEHRYHVKVDGAGRLRLPDVSFAPALRIRTRFENQLMHGPPLVQHQVGLVFECFGEVARLVADKAENADGHSSGELWRFHP